jgi:P2-related tail formation protein
LRDALEQARIDREKAVQDAVVTANHEIVQLKSAATALRDALELERQDKERSVQAAVRAAHDEIQQLKATVSTLRDTLEATDAGILT